MKTTFTPVTTYKLTVTTPKGKFSKRVSKATVAAEHYALHKTHQWWNEKGHLLPHPLRYDMFNQREAARYRRCLKVFKQYLP